MRENLGSTDQAPLDAPRVDGGTRSEPVDVSRRRLAGFGLGAPVIMTLASKPVFGAQCMSNMMSGNLSNHDHGECSAGASPGAWGNPGGGIQGMSTLLAWGTAGFEYGELKTEPEEEEESKKGGEKGSEKEKTSISSFSFLNDTGKGSQEASYTGGSPMSETPFLPPSGAPGDVTMREVVREYNDSLARHLVTAYLNAKLSEAPGATFQYVLTSQQVIDLASGTIPVPQPYPGLKEFLDSTWD